MNQNSGLYWPAVTLECIIRSLAYLEICICFGLLQVDVQGENSEIFPKRCCQGCVDLFRSGIAVQVKNAEGKTVKTMAFFDLVKSLFISMRTQACHF